MIQYIFFVFLCLAIYAEGTFTTTPVVLSLLIPYAVLTQKEHIFLYMFLGGILLDLFSGQTIGFTSLYFLCSIFALLLYQRKYEIASYPFIAFSTMIVSLLYLFLFIHAHIIPQTILAVLLAEVFFIFFKRFKTI